MNTPPNSDPPSVSWQRPDYRPNLIHLALLLSNLLSRVPPLALTPTWMALAAISCWPWPAPLRLWAAGSTLLFVIVDGVGLALLPVAGRSFGPVTPSLLALALLRTGIALGGGWLWGQEATLVGVVGLQGIIALIVVYATWVEPTRLGVTHQTMRSARLTGHTPLRLLHISDLHVERISRRERMLVRQIEALDPDVVVLTGDYLTLSSIYSTEAQAEVHRVLADICRVVRGPIYAVTGSPPVDLPEIVPRIFADLPITWLLDRWVEVNIADHGHGHGNEMCIAGLRCTASRQQDAPRLRELLAGRPPEMFTLLLYHSPDLMPEAVDLEVDLYLCGHTHGGQIRLPFFGAIFTSSEFWKRYEMGRYEQGGTTMYVSRGVGMEGMGAPRARFLSPPEITLWTLYPHKPLT